MIRFLWEMLMAWWQRPRPGHDFLGYTTRPVFVCDCGYSVDLLDPQAGATFSAHATNCADYNGTPLIRDEVRAACSCGWRAQPLYLLPREMPHSTFKAPWLDHARKRESDTL